MLSGRQRIEAAFSPEGTPEIGVVIPYEEIYIRDHWNQLTGRPWWYAFSPQIEDQMAWRREVIPAIGQDWMVLPFVASRAYRESHQIQVHSQVVFLRDMQTGEEILLREPVVGGWESFDRSWNVGVWHMSPDTPQALDELIPLQKPFDAIQFHQEGQDDLARAVLREFGDLYPTGYIPAPLWNCTHLWGFEGFMEMIARKPDLVKHACRRFLHNTLVDIHAMAALGVAGIWIEDCMTDMISPHAFQELNVPFLRLLVEEIRSLGMKSIHYFCGNPAGKLALLLETGADALSLEESKKGFKIDIAEVAEAVRGRCVLLGNLDAIDLLPNGSEAELRQEIARQLAAGRRNGSRFIMSLGSPVTPATSPARVRWYCDTVHSFMKNEREER